MLVHESQIEDILATYTSIAQAVLGVDADLHLVTKQMALPSGRLDLLFAAGNSLLLVELKVEPAEESFVWQVKGYERDLRQLQEKQALLDAPITTILLTPSFPKPVEELCREQNVSAVVYSPEEVLKRFFQELPALTRFFELKPKDYGLWNRYLTHRVLYSLDGSTPVAEIVSRTGLSHRSVMNHLRFAADIHLVRRNPLGYELTDLGQRYVEARVSDMPPTSASDAQLAVIRDYIVRHPFASPVIFGIYTMVDAVFALARNMYPVSDDLMIEYFRSSAGKFSDWKSFTAARHGTRMYSNYAVELGLLGRAGRSLYLTPDGLRMILLLNLHKSIEMIEALEPRKGGTSE